MLHRGTHVLHRFAEAVAVLLLATIFLSFMVQIVMRYVFNSPVGWTTELSLAAWLWLVLWGAAFVLKDEDEIRIDFIGDRGGRRWRRGVGALGAVCVIVLFALSLPASWSYVTFMKVEKSSYLNIRMDWLYSIYIVFVVAVVGRNLLRLIRGPSPPSVVEPPSSGSST